MSVEKPQMELYEGSGNETFESWSTDELRTEVRELYKNYPNTATTPRQELIEVLNGTRSVADLTVEKVVASEPTPEEVASLYFATFSCRPAFSLSLEDQKTALANIDNHKYELFTQRQEERNDEKKAHHHT